MEKDKIVIVGTTNAKVTNYLKRLEKAGEIILKQADDSVVNYFENLDLEIDKLTGNDASNALMSFLALDANRIETRIKGQKLMEVLCRSYDIQLDKITEVFFKISNVSKATNLSNKDALELLKLLEAFGFIYFVKSHIFVFTIGKNEIEQVLKNEIKNLSSSLAYNISKYASYLKNENKEFNESDEFFELGKALGELLKTK